MASKKALIVAINNYGGPPNDLPSCLEDARQFAGLLTSYGFREITTLTDAQATIPKVEEGLTALFNGASDQDRLVFYFSGHGYTKLIGGVMEEMLVLSGADPFFLDNRLVALAKNLPQGVFTAILDSCFSGGMFKPIVDVTSAEPVVEVAQVKAWTPPPEQATKSFNIDKEGTKVVKFKRFGVASVTSAKAIAKAFTPDLTLTPSAKSLILGKALSDPSEMAQPELRGILISACKEDETAAASTSKTNGMSAFTHSLLKAVNSLGSSRAAIEIFNSTEQSLKTLGFRQTPLILESSTPGDLQRRSFLTLEPLDGMGVTEPTGALDPNLLASVLAALVPAILSATTKEFQSPKAEADPTDKILGFVLPMITAIVPAIIGSVAKQFQSQASSGPEQKWLEVLVPAIVDIVARAKGYSCKSA
jgi:hypothetical protein